MALINWSRKWALTGCWRLALSTLVVHCCSRSHPFLLVSWSPRSPPPRSLSEFKLLNAYYCMTPFCSANRIPERLSPGRFDFLFASHQLFHICVVLAALAHYQGVLTCLHYRMSQPFCERQGTWESKNFLVIHVSSLLVINSYSVVNPDSFFLNTCSNWLIAFNCIVTEHLILGRNKFSLLTSSTLKFGSNRLFLIPSATSRYI